MSRIGKQPVELPEGVSTKIADGTVEIQGPKGSLKLFVRPEIDVRQDGKTIHISLKKETKTSRKLWGTVRALLANMVKGVTKGFEKKLELEGVGYRVEQKGKDIQLALGFSHPVIFETPLGIELKTEKNTIIISGISKELVGQVAASIRSLKKPEPYKGKGIRYAGEVIRRKAGKKATAAG